MLELTNIRLVHNAGTTTEVVALRELSLEIPDGQFVTIVGSNGAGKSSLVQIVSGALRPTAGSVRIGGRDVTRWPDYRRAGLVARVFDNPHAGTAPELSIEENMALAIARGRRRRLRFATGPARRVVMRTALERLRLGLERRLPDTVAQLSAGQRQSLTLVMAGLQQPEVLLLDEHLAALDPGTQRRVLDLTLEIISELRGAALMVTHNMEHAIGLGDRLLVMSRGAIVRDFSGEEKANLTVPALVEAITGTGDVVSDRVLLGDRVVDG